MQPSEWQVWADSLKRWGLQKMACVLVEQARPLLPLVAQLMMVGTPLFGNAGSNGQYAALVAMMMDEDQLLHFSHFLREQTA
jgi:hypothetical protein